MSNYIQNILPRIQQYSQSLNRKEIFLDYPWVRIDEQGNKETYIFKRNGELIMSLNGKAEVGRWELLVTAGLLLIDRITDKILLKHDFIDNALMALKTDDVISRPFILVNSNIIKDLNIEAYLDNKYPKDGNLNQPYYKAVSNDLPDSKNDIGSLIVFNLALVIVLLIVAMATCN